MIWFLDDLVTWLPRSVFGTQTTPLQTLLVCNLIQMSPRLAEATNLVKRELSLYDLQLEESQLEEYCLLEGNSF